jgi:hypothetical protein
MPSTTSTRPVRWAPADGLISIEHGWSTATPIAALSGSAGVVLPGWAQRIAVRQRDAVHDGEVHFRRRRGQARSPGRPSRRGGRRRRRPCGFSRLRRTGTRADRIPTHPFHPWYGREFVFLAVRHTWSEDRCSSSMMVVVSSRCWRGGPMRLNRIRSSRWPVADARSGSPIWSRYGG